MGLEISKCYSSYVFHLIAGELYDDIGYYSLLLLLVIGQVMKILWHFEIGNHNNVIVGVIQ